ncbi:fumarate reductase flavoprotein subunit [Maribacter vaceletii]|uniref:Fumarate reductase flavoprotein subunit n=1 Tax=Maribacter vaceletii TaxID=1206816 RepID=A0A495EE75_9FLAO|nr:FAD-dependent oxidoreductase [Maribacter vaceletii]RKR15230.1 fumarate reductase flavoprotein subunit [Maribacter vaceletii]
MQYDILIVGAGTAGMSCAITAAERGLKVGVVEKADYVGGALHWSGGHMSAGGTHLQKEKGIEDSPEKHLEDIYRINNKSGDLDLTEKAVVEAPKTIQWLDDLGMEWSPDCPRIIYGHVAYETARTIYGPEKALSIYKVLLPQWERHIASGAIEIHFNNSFSGLRKTENRYNAVLCNSAEGEKTYTANNIVITTGGYGSNPAYFKEKHGDIPLVSSAHPNATADGHIIVEKQGANFRLANFHLPSLGGMEEEEGSGRVDFNKAWAMVLTSIYRQPRDIYVNAFGKRFIKEDEVSPETRELTVMKQPDWCFWVIFDENALVAMDNNGNHNPIVIGWTVEQIKEEALKNRALTMADSIEELAEKTGLPVANLKETVLSYNQMVVTKEDPDFGRTYLEDPIKKAPFYALKLHASVLVTFGGIKVNNELQIVDKQNNPMEGLYAAGEFLGLGATSGSSFCSGMAITPALSFGRILGKTLG